MAGQDVDQDKNAVVVGAGWAGLSAAHHLTRQGYRVTVLEQTRRAGGRTFSFPDRLGGEILDNGEHVLLGLCRHFKYLLEQAGLTPSVRFQPLLQVPVVASEVRSALGSSKLPGSLHLANSILRYRPLTPLERMRVLSAGVAIQTTRSVNRWDAETFARWLGDHGQSPNAVKSFWEAIGTGILNARAENLSAALALKTFRLLLREGWQGARLGLFVRPLSEITEGYRRYLEAAGVCFKFESRIDVIDVRNSRVTGVSDPSENWSSPTVVLAIPPDKVKALAERSGLATELDLPDFEFSPILNVYLFYESNVMPTDITLLPDDFGAMVFNRTRLLGAEAPDRTTLAVSVSAATELRGQPSSTIAWTIENLVGSRLELPKAVEAKAVWQPHATFLALPGTENARPKARTKIHGLFLAGDWTDTGWPACLEGAVLSGRNAAMEVTAGRSSEEALQAR